MSARCSLRGAHARECAGTRRVPRGIEEVPIDVVVHSRSWVGCLQGGSGSRDEDRMGRQTTQGDGVRSGTVQCTPRARTRRHGSVDAQPHRFYAGACPPRMRRLLTAGVRPCRCVPSPTPLRKEESMPKTAMELVNEARQRIQELSAEQVAQELQAGALLVDVRESNERREHGVHPRVPSTCRAACSNSTQTPAFPTTARSSSRNAASSSTVPRVAARLSPPSCSHGWAMPTWPDLAGGSQCLAARLRRPDRVLRLKRRGARGEALRHGPASARRARRQERRLRTT